MRMRTLARSALPLLLIAGCAKPEPPPEQAAETPAAPAMVHVTATD